MHIRRLEFAVLAAELKSFRKTAAALNVEPSVLSRGVRDLENELGVSLFQRSPNGVTLTLAGQAFIEQAKVGLLLLSDAAVKAAAAGRAETGLVRVGLYTSLASGFLHDLLEGFTGNHSGIALELVEAGYADLVSRVRSLDIDIAFIAQERGFDDCQVEALWTERLLLCLPEKNVLSRLHEVDWHAMRSEHFVVRTKGSGPQIAAALTSLFVELEYPLDLESQDVSREMLMDLVRIGKGVTFVSEAALGNPFPGVAMIPIKDYTLHFYAVWKAENDNPAFRRFLSLAQKMAKVRGGQ